MFSRPVEVNVPLAPRTTLGVGGVARYCATAPDAEALSCYLREARAAGLPVLVLGGGSNVVVRDEGFAGLVLGVGMSVCTFDAVGDRVRVRAEAGALWDDVVAMAVHQGAAGIECLSGIPGHVGAAPIQNIGAYGQELSSVLESVEVMDRASGAAHTLAAAELGLGYRRSHLKGAWRDRYVILAITLELAAQGEATVQYAELQRALSGTSPRLSEVRRAVLAIRRQKSMLVDPHDPNARSAGSFFLNPIVPHDAAAVPRAHAQARGIALPEYPAAEPGCIKLSAAWLIEQEGLVPRRRRSHSHADRRSTRRSR